MNKKVFKNGRIDYICAVASLVIGNHEGTLMFFLL